MTDITTNQPVALVTGGSRGIGAATARRLAADGHAVALTYVASEDRAKQVVADIEAAGGRALAIQSDQADPDAAREAVQRTVAELGGLDVVVANAGVIGGAPLPELTLDEYERVMRTNVGGVLATAQAAAAHIGEGGRVVIIGSVNADAAFMPGMTVYATSKAAVQGMVRGLAHDLAAQGATANVVQPGPINTDMNPEDGEFADVLRPMTAIKRYGTAEEVAATVAFLASPDAANITGATINVDGGLLV